MAKLCSKCGDTNALGGSFKASFLNILTNGILTGKTYIAKQIARESCEGDEPAGRWEIIQFHPAYAYEDFVRGIVAKTESCAENDCHFE